MLEEIDEGFLALDWEYRHVHVNQATCRQVGLEPEQLLGRTPFELWPEIADTPAKLIYLAVQLMYISPDARANHGTYFNLIRDLVTAVPSVWPIIEAINNQILSGDLYQALKECKKLVAYERKLLDQIEALHAKGAVSTAA